MAKKMTVEERKEELERQLKELEALKYTEELVEKWKSEAKEAMDGMLTRTEYGGLETEQAKNEDGELLFRVSGEWRKYTEKEVAEKGIEDAEPYYRDVWETVPITVEDMSDWERSRYEGYKKALELLNSLSY